MANEIPPANLAADVLDAATRQSEYLGQLFDLEKLVVLLLEFHRNGSLPSTSRQCTLPPQLASLLRRLSGNVLLCFWKSKRLRGEGHGSCRQQNHLAPYHPGWVARHGHH